MIEEDATVMKRNDGVILVETISRSSCSHCSSESCTTSVVSKLFGMRRNYLQLPNTLDAHPGDRVVVGIPDSVLVKASLWVYLLPVVSMLLATAASDSLGISEGWQALFALAGLAAGFYSIRWLLRHTPRQQQQYVPVLLRKQTTPGAVVELAAPFNSK